MNQTLYWLPRVFGIMFAVVITLFVFDIDPFSWMALLMHLLPTIIILVALLVAWKQEKIGGILFIVLGLVYIFMAWGKAPWLSFLAMSGPAFVIGILFLLPRHDAGLAANMPIAQSDQSMADNQFQNTASESTDFQQNS